MPFSLDTHSLIRWFETEKRDLPWRQVPSPYAVWVSEVMLQQTQVTVVIPYFENWMQKFPTVQALALAGLDTVIKEWEGLGYYSRARNLHEGAKYVVNHCGGIIPDKAEELKKIKGLGPYTVGAILNFAFHQKTAAVDGNIIRVLSRYFMIVDDIAKSSTLKQIWSIAEEILPDQVPWEVNEGLIELGATICGKKTQCPICPLRRSCQSFKHGIVDQIPFKSRKIKVERLHRAVAVIFCQDHLLVKRGKKGEIMSDLYEFPYFQTNSSGWSAEELQTFICKQWKADVSIIHALPQVSHSFTKYQVKLTPVSFNTKDCFPIEGYEWKSIEILRNLAFSSGHRRILQSLFSKNDFLS